MKLNTVASETQQTGYGRMGRSLIAAMQKLGVQIDPSTSPGQEDEPVHANSLWMGAPSYVTGWWKGQRTNVLTMWEATGVPPGFRENVPELDTIIVPSQQNVELFSRWHDNVKKIPLGINPDEWSYRKPPPVLDEFRFMTAGQGPRKGIDVCIKAFTAVFGGFVPTQNHPRPVLVVKNRSHQTKIRGEGIVEISGTMSPADEINLYANAHAFLGLARGEGWGMMPFQAMAQGTPTILHDAHGHHEFAHLAAITIGGGMSKAEPFIFGDADKWWEPDFTEVCEAMWDMYCNYEDYLAGAKHAAEVIADEYTWKDSAQKLINAMGGESALDLPDLTTRNWYEPTIQLFHIVPSRNCSYEVNGTTYKFQKGEDYWEFGDLKRMMFENQNLDPSCLADIHESGLAERQMDEVVRYKAQHMRCRECGQRLNTDMTLDFDDEDSETLVP
jgi:hypothetical protein